MPTDGMVYFTELESFLASPTTTKITMAILKNKKLDHKDAEAIAKVLTTRQCPQLYLELQNNRLGDKGAIALAQALGSGKCNENLNINLMANDIRLKGVAAFADALASGHCPAKLTLRLSGESGKRAFFCFYPNNGGNKINDKCVEVLAAALKSKNCPTELTLDLRAIDLTDQGVRVLYDAIRDEYPPKLSILLSSRTANLDPSLHHSLECLMLQHNSKLIDVTPSNS